MTLSHEERERLLAFIESKYVDYHDIRLLIARDLEDEITKQMKADEGLSFDDALEQAYETYGVMGFSEVSETYMKKIRKHHYKLVLDSIKTELSTIKFWIKASLLFLSIYVLLLFIDLSPFIYAAGYIVLFIIGVVIYLPNIHKAIKELKKKDEYYYLDELLLTNNSILFPAIYIPLAVSTNLIWITDNQIISMALLAFLTTISFAAIYVLIFNIYKKRPTLLATYKKEYLSEKTNFNLNLI